MGKERLKHMTRPSMSRPDAPAAACSWEPSGRVGEALLQDASSATRRRALLSLQVRLPVVRAAGLKLRKKRKLKPGVRAASQGQSRQRS